MEEAPDALEPGQPVILPVTLNRGFLYPEIRFAVLSESDVYGVNRQKSRARARSGEKISAFTDLRVGDYVVHENHGIGQYMGTVRLASDGTYRDFLHIRYQGIGQALRAHGSAWIACRSTSAPRAKRPS